MRVGVIDVGTNSVRVLVTDGRADVLRDLLITRLGQGVDATRRLGSEPLRRTVDRIAHDAERCRSAGAERIRIIATSAVRDASNREEFLSAVRAATDIEADVLSGDEEAMLGFAGATIDLDETAPYLVVDIGGGSTELVWGTARAERFISLDIGSVRLTERHIRSDPPTDDEITAARADARTHLARAASVIEGAIGTVVGLAGTITTVAAIALGLPGYDRDSIHHSRLELRQIALILSRLASMTGAQRRELPAMPPGREDVIVGGVAILIEVLERCDADACLVSESDILDGAAADLLRRVTG